MSEQEPCPFCGSEVIEPDVEDGDCVYWIDHDESCFLKIKEVSTFFDIYLEAWNTRHERTCKFMPYSEKSDDGVCSKCGAYMYEQDNYCPNCGARVKEDTDAE